MISLQHGERGLAEPDHTRAGGIRSVELSRRLVRAKNPCANGFRWLLRHHPEGLDYQPLLDALVADGRTGDACWLLDQFGATREVLRVDHLMDADRVFAGSIEVAGDIDVSGLLRAGGAIRAGDGILVDGSIDGGAHLEAGWGIRAGGDIVAAGAIRAGESLLAAGELKAGSDYGIYAGLQVQRASWDTCARVSAAAVPDNLLSGCWVGDDR